MIPNFKGCFQYDPESNPLKGLTALEKIEFAHAYMAMWVPEEGFDDFSIVYDSGDFELMANYLVGAGAINSEICFETCKEIEKIIEKGAKAFRKLSEKTRQKRIDETFKDCIVVSCNKCNHIQFPTKMDFDAYEDELRKSCWSCESTALEIYPWKNSK